MYICSFGKGRSSNYVLRPVDIYLTKFIPRATPPASEELLRERICNFSLNATSFQTQLFFHGLFSMVQLIRQKWDCKDLCIVSGSSFVLLSQLLFLVCSHLLHTLSGEQELFLIICFIPHKKAGFCFIKDF